MTRGLASALASMAFVALLAGCGSTPPASPDATAGVSVPAAAESPHAAFEQRQRDRAVTLSRQGRLADAALAWEVLTVLRPDSADYRERLTETRRQVDAAVGERLPRAAQAARRGEIDNATQLYLGVLALQPDQAQAADALRALERERVKRNHLGKYARLTLTRRAVNDSEMARPASAARLEEGNEIEHASMLARQGEFDDAITLLERRAASNPREDATRRLLADIYFQKVQAQTTLERTVAIRSLERSLRLDPTHAGARARLSQLKSAPAASAAPARAASATPR